MACTTCGKSFGYLALILIACLSYSCGQSSREPTVQALQNKTCPTPTPTSNPPPQSTKPKTSGSWSA